MHYYTYITIIYIKVTMYTENVQYDLKPIHICTRDVLEVRGDQKYLRIPTTVSPSVLVGLKQKNYSSLLKWKEMPFFQDENKNLH